MSTPGWDVITWESFVSALRIYKQRFAGKSGQDLAYIRCLIALQGLSITARAARAEEIVSFLNSWAARVSRVETPVMLAAWVRDRVDPLERVASLTVADERLPSRVGEIEDLYASLMATGRSRVRNWSDAANSKALHQIAPGVFVMWDNKVKQFFGAYGDFTQQMHRLARRLIHDSPYLADRMEEELQDALGYSARKPLAKYLDELNVVRVDSV
jgi:hypothetical protein